MNAKRILPFAILGLLGAAALGGLRFTRPASPAPGARTSAPVRTGLVDESPLKTARHLVPLAITPAERDLARQAERIATHEVDLAFSDALRQATEAPPAMTPERQALLAHREEAAAAVAEKQKAVADLTRRLATAPKQAQEDLEDQLDMAKAEVELDSDELDQATEALERVGGDTQARIKRLKAAHQAVEPVATGAVPASSRFQPASGLARFLRLQEARTKLALLRQAHQESLDKGQRMTRRRAEIAQDVARQDEDRRATKRSAATFRQGGRLATGASRADAKATLQALRHHMADQRKLSDYGRRIQDAGALDEVYAAWIASAESDLRTDLHSVLAWILMVLAVVLGVILADRYFEGLFTRMLAGANRVGRMLKMVKFATQALGAIIILILVLGVPSQLTTLFGLAGAGLTVAMKDFIMAFFGWFILVGRNGIHVGDWVEIQGVGGEVVEIGLLRTILMETGNWTDANHPTGRIVSFVNSFAMDKHFFNFTTSGQWMWDELRVAAPRDQDPYVFIDALRALVAKVTAANAALAQAEWDKAGRGGRLAGISAQPALDVLPTADGIEVRLRYLTRAYERHATQRTLNEALMELLHGRRDPATQGG